MLKIKQSTVGKHQNFIFHFPSETNEKLIFFYRKIMSLPVCLIPPSFIKIVKQYFRAPFQLHGISPQWFSSLRANLFEIGHWNIKISPEKFYIIQGFQMRKHAQVNHFIINGLFLIFCFSCTKNLYILTFSMLKNLKHIS